MKYMMLCWDDVDTCNLNWHRPWGAPFAGSLREAVDRKQGRHLQVRCRGRPDARDTLQQLAKDAAGRPHVDSAGVAASGHDHLRESNR